METISLNTFTPSHSNFVPVMAPGITPPDDLKPSLTRRETEVLTWVACGKSNGCIADILGISYHTVDTHIRRIMLKFDVVSRTTAAVKAAQLGMLPAV
ncbi:response regulator transcription factor [Litoreibacter roseus]|uniref:HTH luxR-type domain-containing protein n=1 Tax=Litoreibacter roseus TaxID=2601869 RepID=A0A6N6JEB8_9RHOB|nr:helix-turn-helix transcriptional regulator [Litoreibacter roseus]GFE63552.1 hypothetical protein KIN_06260 [Litoreibacter roseus]